MPIRVAHLVSHPIQYFAPLYREVVRCSTIDLTVYFLSDASTRKHYEKDFGQSINWDTDLLSGYHYRFLPGSRGAPIRTGLRHPPQVGVIREILRGSYDAVWAHAYNNSTQATMVAAGRVLGIPILLRDDQTLLEPRSPVKTIAKQIGLKLLLSRVHGLYVGSNNRAYFERFGIPPARLHHVPYAVNNQTLQTASRALRGDRFRVRAGFGVTDDAPAILFVGKLVPKKAPGDLLAAFSAVRRTHSCWLLYAGDGPLRSSLESTVDRSGVQGVRFLGFHNQSELPRAYSAADVLVLPSRYDETWGLVVNEAMNFGMPVVTSDHVGCAPDLVIPGLNGEVYRAGDISALSRILAKLVMDARLRNAYGAASLRLVSGVSFERSAHNLARACQIAAGSRVEPAI